MTQGIRRCGTDPALSVRMSQYFRNVKTDGHWLGVNFPTEIVRCAAGPQSPPLLRQWPCELPSLLLHRHQLCTRSEERPCHNILYRHRYGLSLLNPLLGDAVSLRHGGRVHLTLAPQGLAWPASTTTVRMAPLQLAVGRSPLLRQLLATLAIASRSLPPHSSDSLWTGGHRLLWLSGSHTRSRVQMPAANLL